MYADRITCCPLVSHGEYVDGTQRQTDGRQTVTLRFLLVAASVLSAIPERLETYHVQSAIQISGSTFYFYDVDET